MKILIFDTETGGVNCQMNDILQLSYQVIDSESQKVQKEVNHYFPWPENKRRVQWGAIQVNGLTEEYLATKELSDRYDALMEFYDDINLHDSSADVELTKRCFLHLLEKKYYNI